MRKLYALAVAPLLMSQCQPSGCSPAPPVAPAEPTTTVVTTTVVTTEPGTAEGPFNESSFNGVVARTYCSSTGWNVVTIDDPEDRLIYYYSLNGADFFQPADNNFFVLGRNYETARIALLGADSRYVPIMEVSGYVCGTMSVGLTCERGQATLTVDAPQGQVLAHIGTSVPNDDLVQPPHAYQNVAQGAPFIAKVSANAPSGRPVGAFIRGVTPKCS